MAQRKQDVMDRVVLRLAIFGVIMIAAFVALFSRLWFLQVLAAGDYRELAKENRVRFVHSEPPRGRILDSNGEVLVENRRSLAVTMDRQVLDRAWERRNVVKRLSELLEVTPKLINERLNDGTVSPYKPVSVVNDVGEAEAAYIDENSEDFPGVDIEELPVRRYPQGDAGSHILGYVNEISPDQLESSHFKGVRPPYAPGDIVGHSGLEYSYDKYLRGKPRIDKVIVNSAGEPIGEKTTQDEQPGYDLVTSIDARVQKVTENALEDGIMAARGAGYQAPSGAVVVMDPRNGDIRAMASFPDYDPRILADGITTKEYDSLGAKTPNDPYDDALLNRPIQAQRQPGSTYKIVTAGAALSTGVAGAYDAIECPGSSVYPPQGGPGSVIFNNWTSAYNGFIGFPTSLEISCDTFYYELGWRMETSFGPLDQLGGDGTERFQKYARRTGFDHETGIDLPNEAEGRVPDMQWCRDNADIGYCPDGWLPGYTVNMSIGQGDLVVTPIQMAVAYSAIANGGTVYKPQLGQALARSDTAGELQVEKAFGDREAGKLPLDATELGVIRDGLELVIQGSEGTAAGAFAGFPLDEYPIAGKTGTAELGETALNDAWFVAYGPSDDPEYVVAVFLERAGHGGESAAPIARQIYEGIFGLDQTTDVRLGSDFSG
jgi:penicillin-binding protein 2